MCDFTNTKSVLSEYFKNKKFDRYAVISGFGQNERCFFHDQGTNEQTLFDMASITKIIGVTLPLLMLASEGKIKFYDRLGDYFNSCPDDKKKITIEQLLTHSGGITPIWYLFDRTDNPEKSVDIILGEKLSCIPGEHVIYSCPGFILLGKIIEKVYGKSLDIILRDITCPAFGLRRTLYNPKNDGNIVLCDTGDSPVLVNDPNSRFLGGVSGNAGVFSCISDMKRLCNILSDGAKGIIDKAIFEKATENHTPLLEESRGLGFLYVDERYSQTGNLFESGSFGHCGHTGTSFFINPKSKLYTVVLTNMTRFCPDYDEVTDFRENLHNAIKRDLEKNQ